MLLIKDPIFCDPRSEDIFPVVELDERPKSLDENTFYLVGDYVYRFLGRKSIRDATPGSIIQFGDRFYVNPHNPEEIEMYDKKYIISEREYNKRMQSGESVDGLEDSLIEYIRNYRRENNIIQSGNIKIAPSGEVYMPEILPTDDPLERVIKLTLRHMKLVLNDYRGQFSKKHGLDNIKSALNGATKNMSILKFLSWCENFELDWEIVFDNLDVDVMNPLQYPVVLSNTEEYPWVDIPTETKNIFTVPLVIGEDPLKRGIKLALWQKQIDLRDYRKKSPTPYLINNMKSALKSKQKMTLPYCINWCEIIDMSYSFRVTNRTDGIWYKMTGYEMTTNNKEVV